MEGTSEGVQIVEGWRGADSGGVEGASGGVEEASVQSNWGLT